MPSETQKALYQRLAAITGRITAALDEEDALTLTDLTAKHTSVMNQLRQAGLSQEPGLLCQVEDMRTQIHEAFEKIHKQRDKLCRQLVMFEKKKKVLAAYAG